MREPRALPPGNKARFYEPELGRFLQPDPIGYAGGMNLYAYVGNDPVNWVDPTGTVWVRVTTCGPGHSGDHVPVPNSWICTVGWRWEDTAPGCGAMICSGYTGNLIYFGPFEPLTSGDLGLGRERFGGGGEGGAPKRKPKYCRNPVYQLADMVDTLAGYGQYAAIGGGLIGQTEPYPAVRASFRIGALALYQHLAYARFAANIIKARFGDYRGAVTDIAFNVLGRAAGVDQIGNVVSGVAGGAITSGFAPSPCQ